MNSLTPEYLQDFLQFVRDHSKYYCTLWADVPQGVNSLEDLPLTDLVGYWDAAKEDKLLTGQLWNGSVFRTGGTTSEPKVVYVAREEIDQSLPYTGAAFANAGILPGDRIANLFHIGGLYAGFAKMTMTLQHVHIPHVHLPITGNEPIPDMANFVKQFKATVIFGNVFTTCRLVDYLVDKGETIDSVRLILFAGESFYKDLRASWLKAFPNMRARPLMYGAADGGLIGVPVHRPDAEDEDIKPLYKVSHPTMVLEILDDDGAVIRDPAQKGRVVLTDVKRRLQPAVRYPMGDIAHWVDYRLGTFELLGRETVALKVGSLFLSIAKLRLLVARTLGEGLHNSFQVILRRSTGKNEVTFRIAASPEDPIEVTKLLEAEIIAEFPKWREYLDVGYIQPLKTEFVKVQDLVSTGRSGKLKDIIEERFPVSG